MILVVVAVIASIAVGLAGARGYLSGGFPGQTLPAPTPQPPAATSCQGKGAAGAFSFGLIAGEAGRLTFNGTVPGPCFAVAVASTVVMHLYIDPGAGANHSWVLIPAAGSPTSLPVFPGAGFDTNVRFVGIGPGSYANFTFEAATVGNYWYICEVPGHDDAGMHGWFLVTP